MEGLELVSGHVLKSFSTELQFIYCSIQLHVPHLSDLLGSGLLQLQVVTWLSDSKIKGECQQPSGVMDNKVRQTLDEVPISIALPGTGMFAFLMTLAFPVYY